MVINSLKRSHMIPIAIVFSLLLTVGYALLPVRDSSVAKADTADKAFSTTSEKTWTSIAKKANTSGVYVKVKKGERVLVSVFADANKGKGKRKWVNVSGSSGGSLGTYVSAGHTYHLTNYAVERYGKGVPIRLLVDKGGKSGKVEFLWSPDCR
ncbi:hypothetical protein ACTHPZ_20605 [Bacillus halotolerans]|uniref:hypothetical protein n=1 Tax=Bacillus halotolerans TaxID=260554 RepID=UPI003F7C7E97